MKKYIALLVVIGAALACTSPEQDLQIQEFWAGQLAKVMPRPQLPPPPAQPEEEPEEPVVEEVVPAKPVKKPQPPSVQFMQITMEDEDPLAGLFSDQLSPQDRDLISGAFRRMRQANQQTAADIGKMFGNETQAQAEQIIAQTEDVLKNAASKSVNFHQYATVQMQLL